MLGSITPLGERARHANWKVTYVSHVVGSTLGGAALGGLLGALGAPVARALEHANAAAPAVILVIATLFGAVLDLRLAGLRIPTIHRQVRQDWLDRYRGWFYGFGFGLQLGTGITTVVVTAAVYSAFLGAFLAGSPTIGLLVGATFGAVRAAPLALAGRAHTPAALEDLTRRFQRWALPVRRATITTQTGVAAVILVIIGLP